MGLASLSTILSPSCFFVLILWLQTTQALAVGWWSGRDDNEERIPNQVQEIRNLLFPKESNTLSKVSSVLPESDVAVMVAADDCPRCKFWEPYWKDIRRVHTLKWRPTQIIVFNCDESTAHHYFCQEELGIHDYPSFLFRGSSSNLVRWVPPSQTNNAEQSPQNLLVWFEEQQKESLEFERNRKIRTRADQRTNEEDRSVSGSVPPLSGRPFRATLDLVKQSIQRPTKSTAFGVGAGISPLEYKILIESLQEEVADLKRYGVDMESSRSALIDELNWLLYPPYQYDIFSYMKSEKGWSKMKSDVEQFRVLKTCLQDRIAEFCLDHEFTIVDHFRDNQERKEKLKKEQNREEVETHSDGSTAHVVDDEEASSQEQQLFLEYFHEFGEIYCARSCHEQNFAPPECRPDKCPFRNPTICIHMNRCLGDDKLFDQYRSLEELEQQQQDPPHDGAKS